MTLQQIARLGKELARFLMLFVGCFRSRPGFSLFQVYVKGLLSNVQRKNVEAMALEFGTAPRTLQRFVESIKWEETQVRDECQRIVAREHAHPRAIGCLDESGTAKSGTHTAAAARQWLGSCGKVDNGVVGVHLSYSAPGFQCLLDSEVYLPKEWADDPERRRRNYIPEAVEFRTKPQIGLAMIDRASEHGVHVAAWTFDEAYGRDSAFLDGLEERRQVFVGEVPTNFHGWVRKPRVLRSGPSRGRGRKKKYPRRTRRPPSSEVQNLVRYSPPIHRAAVATLPHQRHGTWAGSLGSQMGGVLAERPRRPARAAAYVDRGTQRVDAGGEVFPCEPRARRAGRHLTVAAERGLPTLVHRELFPPGQRGTGAGSLRSAGLALRASPFLSDATEPLVLRPDATETGRGSVAGRPPGTTDDGTSPPRHERLAVHIRPGPDADTPPETRAGETGLLPTPKPASTTVPHEDATETLSFAGN